MQRGKYNHWKMKNSDGICMLYCRHMRRCIQSVAGEQFRCRRQRISSTCHQVRKSKWCQHRQEPQSSLWWPLQMRMDWGTTMPCIAIMDFLPHAAVAMLGQSDETTSRSASEQSPPSPTPSTIYSIQPADKCIVYCGPDPSHLWCHADCNKGTTEQNIAKQMHRRRRRETWKEREREPMLFRQTVIRVWSS
jgi:hypothetical protein